MSQEAICAAMLIVGPSGMIVVSLSVSLVVSCRRAFGRGGWKAVREELRK